MNELTNFLVKDLIGENISNKIIVYSGRFQPFHKGHYATYQTLVKKFGKDNVYIGTSNKTDNQKSPLNFKEKKSIMIKMFGIPSGKIVEVKNPYAPVEILNKFNEKDTAFITAVGEKDEMRLGGNYFEKYKDGKDLEGYKDKGYIFISPSQSNPISGTDVRNWLSIGGDEEKRKNFLKAYPKFDEAVYKLITLKLSKIQKENLKEGSTNAGYSADAGEPDVMYIPDGTKRILDKDKPEPWFKQLGYTQLDKPKADFMRGKGKNRDVDSQFRKAYYKVSNFNASDLKPVEKPKGVDGWKKIKEDVIPGGLANGKTLIDLAKKYDEKGYYDPKQYAREYIKPKLMKGIEVEMEHTNDVRIATEIAMDHLWEDINYYEKLAKIEKNTNEELNPNEKEMIDGIVDMLNQVEDLENRKEMAFDRLRDFEKEGIDVDVKQFLSRCGISQFDEMAKSELDQVEKYADSQLSPEDVELGKETDHFFQRLNDPRNGKEISAPELTGFFKRLARNKKKFIEFLEKYKEFVVLDKRTNINIPFMKVANRLIAKTIMRKADFKSSTPIFVSDSINESLLLEGGAYGHMNHPFDIQMNLTFGDLKNIVKKALSGKLELAREKTDGQALAVSWVNGRLVAARNKSHLKNKGKDAMSVQDVISKFAGRGSVSDAFSFAIKDLESAIKGLSEANKKKIFKDGRCFMNCEIIYPENTNVIPYGQSLLVFHGTMEYNEEGTAIGENSESGAQLAAMVKKINADVQSKFKLQGPPIQKLPVNKDLKAKQPIFLSKIQALQSEFGLSDKNGVADYHQSWWLNFINKNTTGLDEQQKIGLVKRWAFGDKGFRIKDIKDPKNLQWAEKIEKQDQQKITKDNLLKFETIFLGVGAEVLSFMTSVLTVNPDSAKQQMVGRLETAINSIKATGDAKNLDKLNIELARIEALGGFEKIVPNEGIVFNYKGNTFKLTGAFAPLNQILGIFTFSR